MPPPDAWLGQAARAASWAGGVPVNVEEAGGVVGFLLAPPTEVVSWPELSSQGGML